VKSTDGSKVSLQASGIRIAGNAGQETLQNMQIGADDVGEAGRFKQHQQQAVSASEMEADAGLGGCLVTRVCRVGEAHTRRARSTGTGSGRTGV
jgi:hypothetical protein